MGVIGVLRLMGVMGALKLDVNFPFIPFIPFVPFIPLSLFTFFVALPANLGDSPLGGLIFEKKRLLSQSERVTTLKQKIR